ncbi:hypothetical protein CEXT_725641 [Caerostris extrusa]|uniref:Uncharacterized protein n=1 Tax=Caerostris extrusa TaxID=172846 RepID=A0AAV4WZZ6_CAEEX|nr:hypothetical protein CEXT_725641 [Caerostris extrusa]
MSPFNHSLIEIKGSFFRINLSFAMKIPILQRRVGIPKDSLLEEEEVKEKQIEQKKNEKRLVALELNLPQNSIENFESRPVKCAGKTSSIENQLFGNLDMRGFSFRLVNLAGLGGGRAKIYCYGFLRRINYFSNIGNSKSSLTLS